MSKTSAYNIPHDPENGELSPGLLKDIERLENKSKEGLSTGELGNLKDDVYQLFAQLTESHADKTAGLNRLLDQIQDKQDMEKKNRLDQMSDEMIQRKIADLERKIYQVENGLVSPTDKDQLNMERQFDNMKKVQDYNQDMIDKIVDKRAEVKAQGLAKEMAKKMADDMYSEKGMEHIKTMQKLLDKMHLMKTQHLKAQIDNVGTDHIDYFKKDYNQMLQDKLNSLIKPPNMSGPLPKDLLESLDTNDMKSMDKDMKPMTKQTTETLSPLPSPKLKNLPTTTESAFKIPQLIVSAPPKDSASEDTKETNEKTDHRSRHNQGISFSETT